MLDFNNYFIRKIDNLKDFFTISYVIINDIYNELIPDKVKNRQNVSKSKLSDSQIITISLVRELISIDFENAWFNFIEKDFKYLFLNIGNRSRFNITKRNLYPVIVEIQNNFFSKSNFMDNVIRIIANLSIPVCKFGRA